MNPAAFTLTAADVEHLAAAQRALLSPLDHATTTDWRADIAAALRPLFAFERVSAFLEAPGEAPFYAEGVEAKAFDDYLTYYSVNDPGNDVNFRARREVTTSATMAADVGPDAMNVYVRSEAFNEWYRPHGIVGSANMVVYDDEAAYARGTGAEGARATLMMYYPTLEPPGSEARRQGLLRLLHPAFEAGVRTLLRLGAARADLAGATDALGEALLLADTDGRTLHHSRALADLLAPDPERAAVLDRLGALARSAAALAWLRPTTGRSRGKGPGGVPDPVKAAIATRAGRYVGRAVILGPALLGRPVVAASLERADVWRPSARALVERWGLTRREAEVALLLAERKGNAEIAAALSISPHTARRHTERVFEKLGVHAREAVRERLLSGA